MEILKIDLKTLRNAEHLQFQKDFKAEVEKKTATALGIDTQFANYLLKYKEEDEAHMYIGKSSQTDLLAESDDYRDRVFRGLCDTGRAALNHFKPEKAEAARKLNIVFDTYGNITVEAYNEETAKINSLIKELINNHSNDIDLLALNEWVDELQTANNKFVDIKNERYTEESSKTSLRMKKVRTEIDALYKEIVNRINAQILLNGDTNYIDFVTALNQRIENVKLVLAKRSASASSATGKGGEEDENSDIQ